LADFLFLLKLFQHCVNQGTLRYSSVGCLGLHYFVIDIHSNSGGLYCKNADISPCACVVRHGFHFQLALFILFMKAAISISHIIVIALGTGQLQKLSLQFL